MLEQITKLVDIQKSIEYKVHKPGLSNIQLRKKMKEELTQYCMNFANDSMQTTMCLQFPPQIIASAMILLASLLCNVGPVGGKDWSEVLDHGESEIVSFCSIALQVIELLDERKGAHHDTITKIKKELDTLMDQKVAASTAETAAPSLTNKRPRIS